MTTISEILTALGLLLGGTCMGSWLGYCCGIGGRAAAVRWYCRRRMYEGDISGAAQARACPT